MKTKVIQNHADHPGSGTQTDAVIRTVGFSKRFGEVEALHPLDLEVPHHSIFGFLGPNGAGKTTTIKLLLGLVALLGPALLFAVAVGVNVVTGARLGPTDQLIDWSELGRLFLVQVVGVLAGAWEELGWRGFALPRLLKRYSPLWASLGVGGLWAAWHIPLFMSGDLPWADAAFLVMASVVFTAVFVRTKQSVLIAFLMHASLNATGGIAIPLFEAGDRLQMYWSMTAVAGVVAIALVALNRRWWLRQPEGG